ncbi:hypothetical protein FA15DRAFT_665772 [Coprinopsis marcescibilis]|uniref:UspA domain-containing protein n=1 Tax=Coprinopsis marcescibilis TaxID=230819 RepID=A0A5C3L629_COPMA|nr:hypothetical protein FA15DRAFT_665772 [Coprinopsis marcescibilis]
MSTDDSQREGRRNWLPKIGPRSSSKGRNGNGAVANHPPSSFTKSNGLGTRSNHSSLLSLATPVVGEELRVGSPKVLTSQLPPAAESGAPVKTSRPSSIIRNFSFESPPTSRPSTPKRRASANILTTQPQDLDNQASQLILNALERTSSQQSKAGNNDNPRHSFLSSMMGSLSLSRTNTRESNDDRGRSMFSKRKSLSRPPSANTDKSDRSQSRARSSSPFLSRWRTREASPPPQPVLMNQSDVDLSEPESLHQARTAFTEDSDNDNTDDNDSDDSESDEDYFDPITERNTEQNSMVAPAPSELLPEAEDADPVGEGVNVVVPPEPYFPTSLNALANSRGKRNPRRRKTMRLHEPLPLHTGRPVFQRDRCTITITQGDPDTKLVEMKRKRRRYVVASDLSEESRYAVEWGIGTVLRDGDEMLLVNVVETDSKIDPDRPNGADRSSKVRNQQERQGMAYILARQVTSLLQRTRLHVTVACQAWHAKNARHMLLDVIDHTEPTMLIVGSRGLSHLNGILLGSTSHYLIEKCSVPVMVARRRLKRPAKKAAHLSKHRTHVKLADAGIDRVAGKVDEDVHAMKDELHKEDQRKSGGPGSRDGMRDFTGNPEDFRDDEEAAEGDNEEDEIPQIDVVGH